MYSGQPMDIRVALTVDRSRMMMLISKIAIKRIKSVWEVAVRNGDKNTAM